MAVQIGSVSTIDAFVPAPRSREAKPENQPKNDLDLDVISQLNANISQLEDLHGRLRFMMAEVEKLTRRKA